MYSHPFCLAAAPSFTSQLYLAFTWYSPDVVDPRESEYYVYTTSGSASPCDRKQMPIEA